MGFFIHFFLDFRQGIWNFHTFSYLRGFFFEFFKIPDVFCDLDPWLFGEDPIGFKNPGIGIFSWDGISHEKVTSGIYALILKLYPYFKNMPLYLTIWDF